MVDIIKHCNYEAPINGETIIHGTFMNSLLTATYNNVMIGKFFKIFPNVWVYLDDHPIRVGTDSDPVMFDASYCDTNKKKSLYLKQLSILFERLNTIPSGQKLLKCLSTYRPLNPLYQKEKRLINQDNFILDSKTLKSHPANIVIVPPRDMLTNEYLFCLILQLKAKLAGLISYDLNEIPLYGQNGILIFTPDVSYVYKIKDKIIFNDPVVSLAHELIHALHSILGIFTLINKQGKTPEDLNMSDFVRLEEYLTYGSTDMNNIKEDIKITFYTLSNRIKCTTDLINSSIDTPYNKNILAKQFALKGTDTNYTHTPGDEVGVYTKAYIEINEKQILKDFGIAGRSTYHDLPIFINKVDVTDKKYYTINNGLDIEKAPKLKLHDGYVRYLKRYKNITNSEIEKYYTEVSGWKYKI